MAGEAILLEAMVLTGVASVATTVLVVAEATSVLVMAALSMGLRLLVVPVLMVLKQAMAAREGADTIIASLAVPIIVKAILLLASQAYRLMIVMDKATLSRWSLGLTSVNSTVAQTTTTTTTMEVIFTTGLGILEAIISM
jgi:hypothetical protein